MDKGGTGIASVRAQRTESQMSLNARKGAGKATRQDGKARMNERSRTATVLESWESRGRTDPRRKKGSNLRKQVIQGLLCPVTVFQLISAKRASVSGRAQISLRELGK